MWAPWVSSYCSWLILMKVCQRRALLCAASVFPFWIFSTAVTLNSKRLICLAFEKIRQFLIRFLNFRVAPGLILDVLSGRYHRVILDPTNYHQNFTYKILLGHWNVGTAALAVAEQMMGDSCKGATTANWLRVLCVLVFNQLNCGDCFCGSH